MKCFNILRFFTVIIRYYKNTKIINSTTARHECRNVQTAMAYDK